MINTINFKVKGLKMFDKIDTDLEEKDIDDNIVQSTCAIYSQTRPKLLSSKPSSTVSIKSGKSSVFKPHLFTSRPMSMLPVVSASPQDVVYSPGLDESNPSNVTAAFGDNIGRNGVFFHEKIKTPILGDSSDSLNEREKSCPLMEIASAGCKADGPSAVPAFKGTNRTAHQSPKPQRNQRTPRTPLELMATMRKPVNTPVTMKYSAYKKLYKNGRQSRGSVSPKSILSKTPSTSLKKVTDGSNSSLKKVKFAPNLLMLVYDRNGRIDTS